MAENQNTREKIGNQEALTSVVANTLVELVDDAIYNLRARAFYNNTGIESVTLPNIRKAGDYAFYGCTRLTTVNLGWLHVLSYYMFSNCTNLTTVYAAETESSSSGPFNNCTALETIYMPELLSLASSMFSNCTHLVNVYIPKLKSGNANAFYGCTALEEIDLRNLKSVSSGMFYNCTSLRNVLLSDECTSIGQQAFCYCKSLTSISYPNVKTISSQAYLGCSALSSVSLPNATSIGSQAFQDVPIESIRFPAATSFDSWVFEYDGAHEVIIDQKVTFNNRPFLHDYNLTSLILNSSEPCLMNNSALLSNTPIWNRYGWIYVPDDLVDAYKEATNWSAYADRIVSLEEYPKAITGTITDSWTEIFAAEDNGTYSTKYHAGDTKLLTIDGDVYVMQILGLDKDDLVDGSGKAKITWGTLGTWKTSNRMYGGNRYVGWNSTDCVLRNYLRSDVFNAIDPEVSERIVEVSKTSRVATSSSVSDVTTTETVFILSAREVGLDGNIEQSGPVYSDIFSDDTSRIRRRSGYACGTRQAWWLRSMNTSGSYYYRYILGERTESVNGQNVTVPGGDPSTVHLNTNYYFPICFCT